MERTEQCAYAKLGVMDEQCKQIKCNGYSDVCFHYTTIEHLTQFERLFGEGNGKLKGKVGKACDRA